MKKKVLIAGLFHETNTFLDDFTALDEFSFRKGDEILGAVGDGSPLGGVLETAEELDWEVLPAADLRAMPSGTVRDEVVERFWKTLEEILRDETPSILDGVFLVLHGAMVSESIDDVEGEILERLSGRLGSHEIPVCGVLDLHANLTHRMCRHSDVLLAYRENPHTDAAETARDAARILDRLMHTGRQAETVLRRAPVIWPPTGTGTAQSPMRDLEDFARRIEAENQDILAVNVFAGFAFADTPNTGVAFSASTLGDPAKAESALDELALWTVEHREEGNILDPPLEEVMDRLKKTPEGPVVIAEPSDNIGGGAPGDGTSLLEAFIRHRIPRSAVVINDARAVEALATCVPGETRTLSLGGRGWDQGTGPLTLKAELVSRSDGRFQLENRRSHLASIFGATIDMGPCAVVRHAETTILLTSKKTPPFDLGQLRSQGIEPETLFAVGVKAAVAHRAAYDPIAKVSLSVDTPGPCSSNLVSLPYRRVKRPIFPLEQG